MSSIYNRFNREVDKNDERFRFSENPAPIDNNTVEFDGSSKLNIFLDRVMSTKSMSAVIWHWVCLVSGKSVWKLLFPPW